MTPKRAAPSHDAPALRRAIALHRFGLGGPDLGVVGADPRARSARSARRPAPRRALATPRWR
jgi:hypothetical protein